MSLGLTSYISNELCSLFNLPSGTQLSRVQVSRLLIEYIKSNGLSTGRKINVNNALASVFGDENRRLAVSREYFIRTGSLGSPTAEVSYFSIQLFLNHNFSQTPFIPPLPDIAPAQLRVNEELQELVFDRPADPEALEGSLKALGGPRFQELQMIVEDMCYNSRF